MALTIAVVTAQAMGAALATDIGAGSIIEIRSGAKPATGFARLTIAPDIR